MTTQPSRNNGPTIINNPPPEFSEELQILSKEDGILNGYVIAINNKLERVNIFKCFFYKIIDFFNEQVFKNQNPSLSFKETVFSYLKEHEKDVGFEQVEMMIKLAKKTGLNQPVGLFISKEPKVRSLEDLVNKIYRYQSGISKIQSVIRGWNTRNAVVLPEQIMPIFDSDILSSVDFFLNKQEICLVLCREMNDMIKDPEKYKGKSVRINKYTRQYPYFIIGQNSKKIINLDFDCRLQMAKDGKSIKVLLVGSELGNGSFKVVSKAPKFEIDIMLKGFEREWFAKTGVLATSQPTDGTESTILNGLQMQATILEIAAEKGGKFASMAEELFPNVDSSSKVPLEMEQEWYNGDLNSLKGVGKVPLEMGSASKVRSLELNDVFDILLDVSYSLSTIHSSGLIHADIKPENILVKATEFTPMEGYISDFDLTKRISVYNRPKPIIYFYWDRCACELGVFTPFTDIYGLGMSIGRGLFPAFYYLALQNVNANPIYDINDYIEKPDTYDFLMYDPLKALIKKSALSSTQKEDLERDNKRTTAPELDHRLHSCLDADKLLQNLSTYDSKGDPFMEHEIKLIHEQAVAFKRGYELVKKIVIKNREFYEVVKNDPDAKNVFRRGTSEERLETVQRLSPHFYQLVEVHKEMTAIKQAFGK